jgi:DNA-binding IclR family transcriptional regulator
VQHGLRAIYIDKVDGTQSVRLNIELGAPRSLHATAIGKLILAFSPPSLLEAVVAEGLTPLTRDTITDPARLRLELAEIRKRGFATSNSQSTEGIYALAAPVVARDRLIAGVCIATLPARGIPNRDAWGRKIVAAAERIRRAVPAPPAARWAPARHRRRR